MGKSVRRMLLRSAFVVALMSSAALAGATENSTVTWPAGVSTVLNGILPPPGATQFYNYSQYYAARQLAGPTGNSAIPNFKLDVFANAFRVVHTWGFHAGPLTLSTGFILPILNLDIHAGGLSDHHSGVGDTTLQPVMISYSSPGHTFFAYFTPDVSVKTGAYSASHLVNPGRNVTAFMPNFNVTWFPVRDVELSGTAVYEIDSPNRATSYHSGNVGLFEYLIGYSVTKSLQLGLQGYFLKQVTDDVRGGGAIGNRAQVIGVGPQLVYKISPLAGIALKYQRQVDVRNWARGNQFWVECSFPI
ncbi:transporter [Paraburkholderia sp. SIMBA_050]